VIALQSGYCFQRGAVVAVLAVDIAQPQAAAGVIRP